MTKNLSDTQRSILYVIYDAFGGCCTMEQALMLDEVTEAIIDKLVEENYLRIDEIDSTDFLICRHSVYSMFGNGNQNFRMTAYNLKKGCLMAEYWLTEHHSILTILAMLAHGTMHQNTIGMWDEHTTYLHSQGCFAKYTLPEERARYFVCFPKSQDPLRLSQTIRRFFDEQGEFLDINEIEPYLSVRVANDRIKEAVLKRIDARHWWIRDRLDFFVLQCDATQNLI